MDSAMLSSSLASGEFGLPSIGCSRMRIWEARVLSRTYPSQPVRNMAPQGRRGAQKEVLLRIQRCKFSSSIKSVPSCKKGRLQRGHTSMKWDLPLHTVPFQTWNRAPHQESRIHFAVSLTNQKYFILNY